ncbi:NADH dehydrogenase FAD-containing subunit [Saccharomonospora amisosensis]|uniref:NADH dehydrogenase FAD-containing subunit n=1 Tax=Saccharomonospora amisosensis TaxID=1128677 RepID=A0A7X5UT38_9PSEU|nr:FAD-dependent oxidoreductase [Saccharomonospora amisosensis]NIJ13387.1 NADH dehydrogenase FAD-containing subunit [Saccharomonospora amisosensis]
MAHRIVVIGAGYSGLRPARRLARLLPEASVTVVNPRARFVERVRLHQVAAGYRPREYALRDLLRAEGAELVVGTVETLDLRGRLLEVDTLAEPLPYDTLVYALGSVAEAGPDGAAEHAVTVADLGQASRLRDRVDSLARDRGTVVVVGGGLTGIESAAELAESHPELRVRLLSATAPGSTLSVRGSRHVRAALHRLGVEVHPEAKVVGVHPGGVELAGGTQVEAGLTVWASGFGVPDLAGWAGIAVADGGRVAVDSSLRSRMHSDVYAVGDSAAAHGPGGRPMRLSCATALPLGRYAADVIAARVHGHQPRELRFRYVIQCVSLGRRDGLIQFVAADDSPHEKIITGIAAAVIKECVVRYAVRSATGR